jgi:hypothetical protein
MRREIEAVQEQGEDKKVINHLMNYLGQEYQGQ